MAPSIVPLPEEAGREPRATCPEAKEHTCSSVGLHPISGRTFQKDVPVVANAPADLEELANETATAGSASDGREASNRVTPGNVEWAAGWAAGSEGQGASSSGDQGGNEQAGAAPEGQGASSVGHDGQESAAAEGQGASSVGNLGGVRQEGGAW